MSATEETGSGKRKQRSLSNVELQRQRLRKLRKFVFHVGRGSLTTDGRLQICTRASFVKAYEFCVFSHSKLKAEFAFHCVGGLRSICEDLIILKFLKTLAPEDQTTLLDARMAQGIQSSITYQGKFFGTFRPGQPVLHGAVPPEERARLTNKVDNAWRRNGFSRVKNGKWPATEQLACKVGQGTIDVLYDYIFRLTSSAVHFSTSGLLRTGWGTGSSIESREVTFSTKNMSAYYVAYCQIYGMFLLSIYFEFFSDLLAVPTGVLQIVQEIRTDLTRRGRWPEMITFEEMNMEFPKSNQLILLALQEAMTEEFKNGFVSGGERRNAEMKARRM